MGYIIPCSQYSISFLNLWWMNVEQATTMRWKKKKNTKKSTEWPNRLVKWGNLEARTKFWAPPDPLPCMAHQTVLVVVPLSIITWTEYCNSFLSTLVKAQALIIRGHYLRTMEKSEDERTNFESLINM